MAPHADCERGAPPGRRVTPGGTAPPPARAWLESDEPDTRADDSPAESRRLLPPTPPAAPPPPASKSSLALGVWTVPRWPVKSALAAKYINPNEKTKCQTRAAKIIDALRPPYFIFSMIIIMVCVQMWAGGSGARARLDWCPEGWWRQPWRLVTYGAVHVGGAHVALNALVAAAVGWRLEREQRWWRVAGVWGGGLVAGALGAGAAQPHVRVVGASAAVYATLTSHLPNVCFRFGHIPLWWFRPLSVAVLALSECCWALAGAGGRPPAPSRVAWEAHLCGALAGVPLGFLFFTGENKSYRWMVVARVSSAVVLAAAAALAALYYTAYAHDHDHIT